MGKSMAMALAEHGSKVVISSRKLDQCEETAAEINVSPVVRGTRHRHRL